MNGENMRDISLSDLAGRWREYTNGTKWSSQLDIFEGEKYAYLIGNEEYDGRCTLMLNMDETIDLNLTGYGKLNILRVEEGRRGFVVKGPQERYFKKV